MRTAVAAALLCLPVAALAQGSLLHAMDTNGDGHVSEAEYVTYMSQGFYRLDRNHDGVLEADELPGGHGKSITLQEWQDNLRKEFRKLDRHHHGYLTEQELMQPPQ
jgi:Ca2+-binding EF-hand superfamily protein